MLSAQSLSLGSTSQREKVNILKTTLHKMGTAKKTPISTQNKRRNSNHRDVRGIGSLSLINGGKIWSLKGNLNRHYSTLVTRLAPIPNEVKHVLHKNKRKRLRRRRDVEELDETEGKQEVTSSPDKDVTPETGEVVDGRRNSIRAGSLFATMMVMNRFRKKFRKKKRGRPGRMLVLSKLVVMLIRLWQDVQTRMREVLAIFKSLDVLMGDLHAENEDDELFFNLSDFRARKQARISQDARRILQSPPKFRTSDEIYYVQVALGNYQSLAEYPVRIQRRIAQRAWYEGKGVAPIIPILASHLLKNLDTSLRFRYNAKRVIVKEGDPPRCFYFILSGSVIVSITDKQRQEAKTQCFLGKGDMFGELAIISRSRRTSTVLTREKVEFMVLGDEDYIDIFLNGGLNITNDAFVSNLGVLEGWPIHRLIDQPNMALFQFFKRNTVIVQDSKLSEWIYVIKSGSCRVLKRLTPVVLPNKKQDKQPTVTVKPDKSIPHEDLLEKIFTDKMAAVFSPRRRSVAPPKMPEINIETLPGYIHPNRPPVSFFEKSEENDQITNARRMSRLPSLVSKGPFFIQTTSDPGTSPSPVEKLETMTDKMVKMTRARKKIAFSDLDSGYTTEEDLENKKSALARRRRATLARHRINDDDGPTYVNIQTLTRGSVFGLSDVVFPEQPSLSVVSNGSECILINKKFYLDHAPQSLTNKIRRELFPYPEEAELQNKFESTLNWKLHRQTVLKKAVRQVKSRKSHRKENRPNKLDKRSDFDADTTPMPTTITD